jgi:hypothetical protein
MRAAPYRRNRAGWAQHETARETSPGGGPPVSDGQPAPTAGRETNPSVTGVVPRPPAPIRGKQGKPLRRPQQLEEDVRALTWHGRRDVRIDSVPDPEIMDRPDITVRVTSTGRSVVSPASSVRWSPGWAMSRSCHPKRSRIICGTRRSS